MANAAEQMSRVEVETPPATAATGERAAPFRKLVPEDFAPFTEPQLMDLAARVDAAEPEARSTILAQSAIGATLLSVCGAIDQVLKPLLLVWGPEGIVVRSETSYAPA